MHALYLSLSPSSTRQHVSGPEHPLSALSDMHSPPTVPASALSADGACLPAGHAEEYEPPGFRGVEEEKLGYFAHKPFGMNVGTVATPYHGVVLRVRSAPHPRSYHPPSICS